MNISEMTTEQLIERCSAIMAELDNDNADLNALETEARGIKEELEHRKAEEAQREELRKQINNDNVETKEIRKFMEESKMEERKITVESAEYRDAFYAYLTGTATAEQRSTLLNVDGNTSGTITADAIAIPKTLDDMIWDNIHSAHPILADITSVNSGVVMEVTKHTAIAQRTTKKKDADELTAAEDNTFVKITLAGNDYAKYVELTYAEAKMSQGALESYMASEIAAELGEALAKDVFAQIISDAGTGRKVAASGNWFSDLATALGTADRAVRPVVYCSAAKYYAIFGATDTNGQPVFRNGVAINADVKIDSAAGTNVVIVDPSKFVLNVIQNTMVESDKDIKQHKFIISGYLRAEGCMRDNGAAAYIQ